MYRKKILFVIPDLSGGGAERVFLHLVNNIDRNRFQPVLVLLRKQGAYLEYLAKDVPVLDLNCRLMVSLPKIIATVSKQKPDCILSTIGCLNIVIGFVRIAFRQQNIQFIVRESNLPLERKMHNRHPFNADCLHKIAYRMCHKVICQSQDMMDEVRRIYRVPDSKLVRIHNPVDTCWLRRQAQQTSLGRDNRVSVVAMGKLHPQKGFDLLLSSVALARNNGIHLHILGDGPEKERLRQQAVELRIHRQVTFHGFQKNPYPYLARADAFVLSSRYEGFPNALLEAIALGRPAIAFDCRGGIREIIKDGVNGILVPNGDLASLAGAMNSLEHRHFDTSAVSASAERFSLAAILSQYEALLGRFQGAGVGRYRQVVRRDEPWN